VVECFELLGVLGVKYRPLALRDCKGWLHDLGTAPFRVLSLVETAPKLVEEAGDS
jgi:hypothetical protein